ncbi:MAG: glycosyltransferase family 39 protein [Candidatus Omnitrophota bacterium]
MKKTAVLSLIFLTGLLIFHALNNFIWLAHDNSLRGCDVIVHLNRQLHFFYGAEHIFSSGQSFLEKIHNALLSMRFSDNPSWPKSVYAVASLVNVLFGRGANVSINSNLIYLSVLIAAVYLLGKEYGGNDAGLTAAAFIGLYPVVWGLSRKFGLDLPLTAFAAVCVYALIKTDGFKNRFFSVLFGIFLGAAMLIKLQAAIFVAGPLGYVVSRELGYFLKHRQTPTKAQSGVLRGRLSNLVVALALAGAVSSFWWFFNFSLIWKSFFRHCRGDIPVIVWQLRRGMNACRWMFFYARETIINISPLFLAVFAVAAAKLVINRVKKINMLLVWIALPYIIFTLITVKRDRYLIPALPAIAVLSAVGIGSFKPAWIKKALVTLIFTLGLVQFFTLSYDMNLTGAFLFDNKFRSSWAHAPSRNNYEHAVRELFLNVEAAPNSPVLIIPGKDIFAADNAVLIEYLVASHYFPGFLPYVFDKKAGRAPDTPFLITTADLDAFLQENLVGGQYQLAAESRLYPEKLPIYLWRKTE